MTYDLNGNILSLKRNGEKETEQFVIMIDDLDYDYDGNRLINVKDATDHSKGFDDGNDPQESKLNDFEYDDYGNMVEDRNKGITEIIYNHLNTSTSLSTGLPKEIKFGTNGTIKYLYDANGNKLKKKVTDGTTNKTVDYLDTSTPLSTGGFQYTKEKLEFFPTAEGYVRAVPMSIGGGASDYSFHYIFNYTDHTSTSLSTGLGNIRLKYTAHPQTGETQPLDETEERGSRTPLKNKQGREQNHYYPFACPERRRRGLTHDGYQPNHKIIGFEGPGANVTIIPTSPNVGDPYKYKFGGKEYQDEFDINTYDFGARNYDPALGRWMNVDPLAEQIHRHSPYNYAFNNPIFFIDPDGMMPGPGDGGRKHIRTTAITNMTLTFKPDKHSSDGIETVTMTNTFNSRYTETDTDGNESTVYKQTTVSYSASVDTNGEVFGVTSSERAIEENADGERLSYSSKTTSSSLSAIEKESPQNSDFTTAVTAVQNHRIENSKSASQGFLDNVGTTSTILGAGATVGGIVTTSTGNGGAGIAAGIVTTVGVAATAAGLVILGTDAENVTFSIGRPRMQMSNTTDRPQFKPILK